jgi:hypothetical protein
LRVRRPTALISFLDRGRKIQSLVVDRSDSTQPSSVVEEVSVVLPS